MWAGDNLKGKQRTVVESVAKHGGEYPLADIAPLALWDLPCTDLFNNLKKAVNVKLKRKGWRLERHDNKARLARIGQK